MISRIHRGFHRIGVVLAVPLLLLAMGVAGHETWLQWTTKDPYAAFERVPEPTKPPNPYDQFDTPGAKSGNVYEDMDRAARAGALRPVPPYRADYTMASIFLAFGLALYVAARAVGWVLDGFMGTNGRS